MPVLSLLATLFYHLLFTQYSAWHPYKVNGRPDKEISVNLAYLTTIEKTLQDRPTFGVGSLIANHPREMGLEVVHDPIYPDNEAHSLIKGTSNKQQCFELAKNTRVLKKPI